MVALYLSKYSNWENHTTNNLLEDSLFHTLQGQERESSRHMERLHLFFIWRISKNFKMGRWETLRHFEKDKILKTSMFT